MGEDYVGGPEHDLVKALFQVLNRVPSAVEEDLRDAADLSPAEYQALSSLARVHPDTLRLGELAELTGLSNSRASRLADVLVGRGHATRQPVAEDGRESRLAISEQGLERVERASAGYAASIRRHVLDRLRREEVNLAAFAQVLRDLLP